MAAEQTPKTLAQLIGRRIAPAKPKTEPVADRLGQFGLLFQEPEPEHHPVKEPEEQRPAERTHYTVAELVSTLRGRIEKAYDNIWVEGEISNCRPAPSGHLYFTLKDGDAQLPVVLFRREASLLKFRPQDGLAVLARGRVSVYESRGQLQLIAENLEPRGAGALQIAFEQLREKLRGEGLFEADRKRLLPPFPQTVGVITSRHGAVLRDIATVIRRRHACLNLLVYPATVQGPNCASDVVRGLRFFNSTAEHKVDLIIVARGGGSAEDLAGFNDEAVARAIAASELPVVSAIGHETDFTIADFVADLRAPTPSAAAELVTAAQHRIEERVQSLGARLFRATRFQLLHAQQRLARVAAPAAFARMRSNLGRREQRADELRFRLEAATQAKLQTHTAELRRLQDRLQQRDIRRTVLLAQTRNERLLVRLERIAATLAQLPQRRLLNASTQLHALSPKAVLQRGYALVFDANGKLLRAAENATAGSSISVQLASGRIAARVLPDDDPGTS